MPQRLPLLIGLSFVMLLPGITQAEENKNTISVAMLAPCLATL